MTEALSERRKRLARNFAAEWLRPSDPDHADPALLDTLQTTMVAFFACASRLKLSAGSAQAPETPLLGLEAAQTDRRISDVLAKHWIVELRCNHDLKTDQVFCSCASWKGPELLSVGSAVRAWADHVAAELRAASDEQAEGGRP